MPYGTISAVIFIVAGLIWIFGMIRVELEELKKPAWGVLPIAIGVLLLILR